VSAYPTFVEALLSLLPERTDLLGVNILDHEPVNISDLRTQQGAQEAIWFAGGDGSIDTDVLGNANLIRFTERLTVPVYALALGLRRPDDATRTRLRAGVLVNEVLAEVARQSTWDEAALGLNAWDEWSVLPSRVRWLNDRVEATPGAYGAWCQLDLTITARRTYS
jgi:hypothetical protein